LEDNQKREGGHILILPSEEEGGGLSTRTPNYFRCKGMAFFKFFPNFLALQGLQKEKIWW